jgi:hypothetical protein
VCFTVVFVTNHFNSEARAFVASYDKLGLEQKTEWTLPEPEVVRPMIQHAEFFRDQANNPLMDFDIPQLLVIDLANDFLRWCADPSQPRWRQLFRDRNVIRECFDFFERYKDEDDTE